MTTKFICLASSALNGLFSCIHQLWEQNNIQQEGWFANVQILLDFVSQASSVEARVVLEAAILCMPPWE